MTGSKSQIPSAPGEGSRAKRARRARSAAGLLVVLVIASACSPCGPGGDSTTRSGSPTMAIAASAPDPASGTRGAPGADRASSLPPPSADPSPLVFRAQELPFRYERGETGAAWPVETTGGGVGILDCDGDGRLDLFFAQGGPLLPGRGRPPLADVLLRSLGGGRFEDVSARVGLTPKGYGQGVAVADYDGDGDPDVYVTRYGRNTLWRNYRGRFTDATVEAGVGVGRWSLGAAFADYDGDGDLDLFVANYFSFDEAKAPFRRDINTWAADYG